MEKLNVILDTDISNEIDDQFALAYLIKSLDKINLQAITIAPFTGGYTLIDNLKKANDLSFNTAGKILDMLNAPEYKKVMYQGAINYSFESKELNPASEKIIELAKANEHTTIIGIGAITNIAIALYHAPEIASKIDIVWLGGHSFLSHYNTEFNFEQDVEGVRIVFNSKAPLIVIPCNNVASNLSTTIYELEHYLLTQGEIGKYLCEIFAYFRSKCVKNSNDFIGDSSVLWDISAVAYVLNKDWFNVTYISCPNILDDMSYEYTTGKHQIGFVENLHRNKIFNDFFTKLGCK